MRLFAILLTIMTKNPIFDVSRDPDFTTGICAPYSLAYSSEKSEETLKKLSKTLEKHLERDSEYFPSGKRDIDFITLWDDPMQDGSVTIIHIFELLKQTGFALVVMIVGSEREHLILLWIIKKQASKRQNFMEINLSSFDHDFCLTRHRSLLFYVLLKTFLCFHGV